MCDSLTPLLLGMNMNVISKNNSSEEKIIVLEQSKLIKVKIIILQENSRGDGRALCNAMQCLGFF